MKKLSLVKAAWLCCSRFPGRRPIRITKGNDVCRVYEHTGHNDFIIVFDGSNDLKDWVSNFRANKDGDIHSGFYASFLKFEAELSEYLNNRFASVTFAGHSRGGALATIAARYFIDRGALNSCSCITFGSPKVGDREYRDGYNKLPIDHTGYRNGWDLVTYTPPSLTGYRHVGKIVRLKRPWYRKYLITLRVRDHFTAAYTKAVNKHL